MVDVIREKYKAPSIYQGCIEYMQRNENLKNYCAHYIILLTTIAFIHQRHTDKERKRKQEKKQLINFKFKNNFFIMKKIKIEQKLRYF